MRTLRGVSGGPRKNSGIVVDVQRGDERAMKAFGGGAAVYKKNTKFGMG